MADPGPEERGGGGGLDPPLVHPGGFEIDLTLSLPYMTEISVVIRQ